MDLTSCHHQNLCKVWPTSTCTRYPSYKTCWKSLHALKPHKEMAEH